MSRSDKGSVKAWQQRGCIWQGLLTYRTAKRTIHTRENLLLGEQSRWHVRGQEPQGWSLPYLAWLLLASKEILEATVVSQFRGCGGEITGEPLLGASLQAGRGRNADREQAFDRDVVST